MLGLIVHPSFVQSQVKSSPSTTLLELSAPYADVCLIEIVKADTFSLGVHPFNAETPWKVLTDCRITPSDLHYVRNHGSVPRLNCAEYQITVQGLEEEVNTFSMTQLRSFPKHSVVCTLVCSGNR